MYALMMSINLLINTLMIAIVVFDIIMFVKSWYGKQFSEGYLSEACA